MIAVPSQYNWFTNEILLPFLTKKYKKRFKFLQNILTVILMVCFQLSAQLIEGSDSCTGPG